MYYYKKYWLLLLVYIALGLGALRLGYKLLVLLTLEVFKLLGLDMGKYAVIADKMQTFSINWFNNLLALLTLVIVALFCWLIINLITGQFKRDITSRQLVKSLLRHVSSSNIKLVAEEEKLANKWLKFGRIIRKRVICVLPKLVRFYTLNRKLVMIAMGTMELLSEELGVI